MAIFCATEPVALVAQRALVDPTVSVASLEQVTDETLLNAGHRNLDWYLQQAGDQIQWREACQPKGMAAVGVMVAALAIRCRDGVGPTKKLEVAIIARNRSTRLKYMELTIDEFANVRGFRLEQSPFAPWYIHLCRIVPTHVSLYVSARAYVHGGILLYKHVAGILPLLTVGNCM